MQKRLLNRNTNTNFKTNKNLYKTFNYDTEATEKIRAKMESEKKEYEEKIRMMINHISAMKRQQEDVARKINFLKQKEENLNNAKREKENARKAIMEMNNLKKNELEKKRKNVEKKRENQNKRMKKSAEKTKTDRINNYRQLQKEKEDSFRLKDINKQNSYSIKGHTEKIKSTRENNKNNSTKRRKMVNKNYHEVNEKKPIKDLKRSHLVKNPMRKYQTEANEGLAKYNRAKKRLNKTNSPEDRK
jgi:hypothetical protein